MNEEKRKPQVDEIIETLHAAREICIGYERKYNMLSEQFYELYSQGLLDDDGLNYDFVDWAGSYKTVLECQHEYAIQIKQSTPAQKIAQLKTHAMVA